MTRAISPTVRTIATCLALMAGSNAFAQTVQSADAPPVENASFHQLVFSNDDVAILSNRYPPGGESGFHAHYRDLFAVVIQSASSSAQNLGGPLRVAPTLAVGAVAYSPVGATPRVHRVINGAEGGAHYIVVELRRPQPLGAPVSSRASAPQYVQVTDNPRLRAWRLILEPGESAPTITQGGAGVRVVVRGGLLTTSSGGYPDQTLSLKAGEFALQDAGGARSLRNSGTDVIELIELELK